MASSKVLGEETGVGKATNVTGEKGENNSTDTTTTNLETIRVSDKKERY